MFENHAVSNKIYINPRAISRFYLIKPDPLPINFLSMAIIGKINILEFYDQG